MADRRAFQRLPKSAIPGLTALSPRSPSLNLVDISEGGLLIETPNQWKPGEHEPFLLQGGSSVMVAGCVLRVEVVSLTPSLSYRSAIQFISPVALSALTGSGAAASDGSRMVEPAPAGELSDRFARMVRTFPGVEAIRISSSLITMPGTESMYFDIPNSAFGERRLLQVFLSPSARLTSAEFVKLKNLALVASGLPNVESSLR
jgi:PilZ domain